MTFLSNNKSLNFSLAPKSVDSAYEGPLDASIALVGEALGDKEEAEGRPFIGPAGQELDRLLHSADIPRLSCFITNVVKERPRPSYDNIKDYIDVQKGIITAKGMPHVEKLREDLSKCSANVFVALGAVPLFALTGLKGITKWRSSILESSLLPDRKVIATFHPSTLIGQKAVYLNRHIISADLSRAKEESQYPELRLPTMILRTGINYHEAIAFLQAILTCPSGTIVDIDIETLRDEISCIGFTSDGIEAMCIPFVGSAGHYWTIEQESDIWRLVAAIMESPNIVKRGQNLIAFDATYFHRRHGICSVNLLDIMVKQNIIYPDFKKGLDFITSSYTKMPYYKEEGKTWQRITGDWKQHWEYNCKDVIATALSDPVMNIVLHNQGNEETFKRQNALWGPLSFMMARGVRVDHEGLQEASTSVLRDINNLQNKLNSTCGEELNVNSPKQMMAYFYDKKKVKPYINKDTKKPRCDDDALMRIARQGITEAQLVRDIRELRTLHSRYLTVVLDSDGRIRCTYKPAGTKTGRLSSSETADETGTNLQNQPEETKRFLLFDEDDIGYNIDLSQAENRLVGYCGPVQEMIDCFENGEDVHSKTAALIFNTTPTQIKEWYKAGVMCEELAGGRFPHRQWGKKANHGLNYGEGPIRFAEVNDISIHDAKLVYNRYHHVYPGVKNGFHSMIESMLKRNRTTTNPMGRKRLYLDRWGTQLFNMAYNNFPQSTVADVINERGLEYVYYNERLFASLELLMQVHDSIVFQIPRSVPLRHHAEMLLAIKSSLETPLTWRGRTFSLPIDLSMSIGNIGKYSKSNPGGLREVARDKITSDSLTNTLEELLHDMRG